MKNRYSKLNINSLLIVSIAMVFLFACENKVTDSLYDTINQSNAAPVIESIVPGGKALSGVSEVTINGNNFSTVFEENLVTFGGGNPAEILEATPTKLVVKAPLVDIPSDSDGVAADIRVAVAGAELASEVQPYRLLETAKELFVDENSPLQFYGICVDANTNIYASAYTLSDRIYRGEYILRTDGSVEEYNQKGFTHFATLKVGPDGAILGAWADKVEAIFEIVEGSRPDVFAQFPAGTEITDFDTDASQRVWAGGNGGKIYSVSYPDKDISEFDFSGSINAIRVFDDGGQVYLYVSVVRETVERIIRMPINGDGTLGSEEEYFNLSEIYGDGIITKAINITTDGTIFVANNGLNPIVMISTDKTVENLYPNLLKADEFNSQSLDELVSMTWGTGDDLYFVRKRFIEGDPFQNIVRVLTQKQTAPYYGRDL